MTSGLARLPLVVVALAAAAAAQDWPHWRGPHFTGATEAEGLPAEFDQTENVQWVAAMPGPAACTPIVVGDRIFLTSVDTERDRLVAMCLDRTDGGVTWQKDAGSGFGADSGGSRTVRDRQSNYATPSPTVDGERVVFFFGNGDLVAYDYDGTEVWRRNLQEDYGTFAFNFTFSVSPTIWEGKLFLPVLQRDVPIRRSRGRRGRTTEAALGDIESFLLAIDPKTGKDIYRHQRSSPARMESREAYTTAIPLVLEDRKEILVVGGDVITGHDPDSGDELWRWGTWNEGHRRRDFRIVPSAVTGGEVIAVCGPKGTPMFALQTGLDGELDTDAVVWKSQGRRNPVSTDVPTPAFFDGSFYVLGDLQKVVSRVDAESGEVFWTKQLSQGFLWRASPTVADGKVFVMNHGAEVVVLDADSGEILNEAAMGDEDTRARASIVVAHDRIFIRTEQKLYCIGK